MPHADVADQALEPFTPGGRCTGLSLIVVDDDNLLVAPSEGDSTPPKGVVARITRRLILGFGFQSPDRGFDDAA
ncbi:hypothetical protein [Rhizobium leguminosarum]|uniref:hypothetical protein n=1 Tax=Rhizobium leguminosarum TaxID=384 RepID=UPI001F3EEE01|nr:hypothetical protein [Rhizobium leguminosarum]